MEAFRYLEERHWSVIPLKGKVPAIDWKSYQDRLPTAGEVAMWFGNLAETRHNIGIVTGAISNLTVVDCDTREEAVRWYKRYPKTGLMVRTGKGVHFYYRHSGQRNRQGVQRQKIDIRAQGGFVVGPPSIHPTTGKPYEWIDVDFDDFPVFQDEWIMEPRPSAEWKRKSSPSDVRETAITYAKKNSAFSGSGGHNATFRCACKILDFGLSPDEALGLLIEWNETNAHPPWTLKELHHKIDSALRRNQ